MTTVILMLLQGHQLYYEQVQKYLYHSWVNSSLLTMEIKNTSRWAQLPGEGEVDVALYLQQGYGIC